MTAVCSSGAYVPGPDKALLKVDVSPDFLVHPLLELLVQHEQVQDVDRASVKKIIILANSAV